MGSTFTKERNLMPERWVQVTLIKAVNCFKNVCFKLLMSSSHTGLDIDTYGSPLESKIDSVETKKS